MFLCTGDMVSSREAASNASGITTRSFALGIATSQVKDQLHSSGYTSHCNTIFSWFLSLPMQDNCVIIWEERTNSSKCVTKNALCLHLCSLCILPLPLCSSMSILYSLLSKYFPRHRNKWTCDLKLYSLTLHITHKTKIWDDFFRKCNLSCSHRKGCFLFNWQCISDTTKCMWAVSEQKNVTFPTVDIAFGFSTAQKVEVVASVYFHYQSFW